MSIKALLSSDGLEEVYTAPTLKEMCLYKCLTNKDILTKEVEVEDMDGSEKLPWEKFRLKEPIQGELVEALLDAGDEFLFMLTPKYAGVLAAIRMSQPEHLVKVHVSNTDTLRDCQLEFLLSGGNVKSLDIHECKLLENGSLNAINKFGSKLEYLRIGNSTRIWSEEDDFDGSSEILKTPNLKTFIISKIYYFEPTSPNYWRLLLQAFISNLEDLQIVGCGVFPTLEFLESAKLTKLSFLTLRDCDVKRNAWVSLFKLDKLRCLDVVNSSIEEAVVGENVVQRLLTAMPNLTSLAVDPGLVKNMHVDTTIRGQGSMAKRLQFLGLMENDATELRKANLLANEVAYFGTDEGDLLILEYISTRIHSDSDLITDLVVEKLLERCSIKVSVSPPWNSVAVINLALKYMKCNRISDRHPQFLSLMSEKLLTPDFAPKLGDVLIDQCIGAIFCIMTRTSWWQRDERHILSGAIGIITNLDGKLGFDHYATIVPTVMITAASVMTQTRQVSFESREEFKILLEKVAQLLEKVVDRFPEETDQLWGIPSITGVFRNFKSLLVSRNGEMSPNINGLLGVFSSMIESVRKLCLTSSPCRAAFHSTKGVRIVLELLSDIIDGYLAGSGLADRDSIALLEILNSIVQDTKLDLSEWEFGVIAPFLEKLLLSVHPRWKLLECPSDKESMLCLQQQSIVNVLNNLESDPRFDYKASSAVNEIMMKLKST